MALYRVVSGSFGPICEKCVEKASKHMPSRPLRSVSHGAKTFSHRPNQYQLTVNAVRSFCQLTLYKPLHPQGFQLRAHIFAPTRGIAGGPRLVGVAIGRILKIRYLLIGSAVGCGVTIHQKYESFRDHLPDMSWLGNMLPQNDSIESLRTQLKRLRSNLSQISVPSLPISKKELPTLQSVQDWLDEASRSDPDGFGEAGDTSTSLVGGVQPLLGMGTSSSSGTKSKKEEEQNKMDELQSEMIQVQMRYQKEIDRLEKENRELRKQMMLRESKNGKKVRKMKRSLIDMYSEVLDELADYDTSYNTQDHLPRVIVVGDQSSGKTSVLEMIARARIFPRGSGEMMTRSPVKVTLSEGPYHIAQFKESSREYDLTKESELEALRKEIEIRMRRSVAKGMTVSGETISLTVRGPGIQRMVLVDLPGIISTVTTGMAVDTKDSIQKICKHHMENPNAIILCIQDGSLDAERSNVTDLVSSIDPGGKRTIFVLTKVDLAESQLYNPDRIKKILEGKLFPMKALGYFAVVTGKGNTSDSIQDIKDYEEFFFRNSRLFKDGVLKPHQMTTQHLSFAVAECFWKMVRESVEQQADAFKATRFNLETEWKNTFPRVRELDREELFDKARGEILDELINLSQVTPQQWEAAFRRRLWFTMADHVFEEIYLPATQSNNSGVFNTAVDIKLKQWADKYLPEKCVQVGWETLREEFTAMLERHQNAKDHDNIFDVLKFAVKDHSMDRHQWDAKAEDSLRVIQMNTLEDRSVHDKTQWDTALQFMETVVKDRLSRKEEMMKELTGPGTRHQWMYWKSKTSEQQNRGATMRELEKQLQSRQKHRPALTDDEMTTVRKNLETANVQVDNQFIQDTWKHLYEYHFLQKALRTANECKKAFFYYQQGFSDQGMECNEVVLFWRIQRMINVTSNALRQQVMNNEARRLEKNIKSTLEDLGEDKDKLAMLLTGKRVTLAEELKRVRQIQELLEEFVIALKKEKP